jgi:hypothetical protein
LTATEDGRLYVIDTVRGRRQKPWQIAERIKARVPSLDRLEYIVSDTAPFQDRKDRNDTTPTIAEELLNEHGISLRQATGIDRRKGLNNMRGYLAWKGLGLDGSDGSPALRFFDTPGNRWLFEQLEAMTTDENDPEDVVKVNADPETGKGGDDGYESLRNAIASRPPRAIGDFYRGPVTAFSRQTLQYMVEHLYRDRPLPGSERANGLNLSTFFTGV